tara:strand:- start:10905 stop:11234 length:330 start_codon:yes stop_codon:yes gene_type:complete
MQQTRFYKLSSYLLESINSIIADTWSIKSIKIISLFLGFYFCSTFLSNYLGVSQQKFLFAPLLIIFFEIIIRLKPRNTKGILPIIWLIVDNLRLGSIYALILEAFKLGS